MPERSDRVTVEVADGIADVRLTRADKHNGLDGAMFEALNEAIDEVGADDEARVVVLSGDGPSFCAGLDFKSFTVGDGFDPDRGFSVGDGEIANHAQRVAYGWRQLEVPVIAALRGAVLGGGLQIALAADIRFAAPDTQMSVMEVRYGLIPDMSISQTLPRLVRDDIARELTYTGRIVEAAEAAELGLVTRLAEDPVVEARSLATQIAAARPEAIRSAKRLLSEAPGLSAAEGLALEAQLQRALIGASELAAPVSNR